MCKNLISFTHNIFPEGNVLIAPYVIKHKEVARKTVIWPEWLTFAAR